MPAPLKIAAIATAGSAVFVIVMLAIDHGETVLALRKMGVTNFPAFPIFLLIPATGVAAAAWLLRMRRDRLGLVAAGCSLVIVLLFALVQCVGHGG